MAVFACFLLCAAATSSDGFAYWVLRALASQWEWEWEWAWRVDDRHRTASHRIEMRTSYMYVVAFGGLLDEEINHTYCFVLQIFS